ncbi:VCBS domain-containing protein [Catenovulum adriaticum]|uniref:VCBS domain-containing protein n=1 Tax=Catenovulum adriaticum TaxID=2984846 RepID=A0ABY7AS15_9ALTE|nr:VCBS domain-containing protein [Catenovulum sp. TS8]WAJ72328.1 VCBS domain-containing protein [Catenovulum sp. TS8]
MKMKTNLITLGMLLSLSACSLDTNDDNSADEPENTPASISGDITGELSSDATTNIAGSLVINDVDEGEAKATSQSATSTTYGTFSVEENGDWTYALDTSKSAVVGLTSPSDTLTDTINVTSADGTSSTITITITGVDPTNTPATFGGEQAKTIENDTSDDVTGTVTIIDPDSGEATLVSQVSQASSYGTFSIDDNGAWVYTLTTSNTDVSGLVSEGDTLTDTIEIESADGTTSSIVITITGSASSSAVSKVAKLTDTKDSDTGELRLKLADQDIDPLQVGKLTLSFKKEAGAQNNNPNDTDTDFKDAYIGLYGSSVSTGKDLIELRMNEGTYQIRNQDDIDVAATFTGDEWVNVEFTWDASNASDTVQPIITASINGTPVTTDAFSAASTDLSLTKDGLQYLSFKIGDNDATVPTAFYLDDIKIYSDIAGTVIVYEDNFESYDVDATLESTNDASPYHSNTNEVVVVEQAKE